MVKDREKQFRDKKVLDKGIEFEPKQLDGRMSCLICGKKLEDDCPIKIRINLSHQFCGDECFKQWQKELSEWSEDAYKPSEEVLLPVFKNIPQKEDVIRLISPEGKGIQKSIKQRKKVLIYNPDFSSLSYEEGMNKYYEDRDIFLGTIRKGETEELSIKPKKHIIIKDPRQLGKTIDLNNFNKQFKYEPKQKMHKGKGGHKPKGQK